jgi:hypothetical protein
VRVQGVAELIENEVEDGPGFGDPGDAEVEEDLVVVVVLLPENGPIQPGRESAWEALGLTAKK